MERSSPRGGDATPGLVINGRHAPETLAIFLMSASIAATADSTAVRAVMRPLIAADRPLIPSLARNACSMKAGLRARGRRIPNTTARPLTEDKFRWPRRETAVVQLTTEQLHWILDGIDIDAMVRHPVRQYQVAG